jgi:hypothetical protein
MGGSEAGGAEKGKDVHGRECAAKAGSGTRAVEPEARAEAARGIMCSCLSSARDSSSAPKRPESKEKRPTHRFVGQLTDLRRRSAGKTAGRDRETAGRDRPQVGIDRG